LIFNLSSASTEVYLGQAQSLSLHGLPLENKKEKSGTRGAAVLATMLLCYLIA
jgi:hypothetical protein